MFSLYIENISQNVHRIKFASFEFSSGNAFNFRIKLEENFTSFWVNGSKHIDLQLPEKFLVCRSQTVSQTIVLASHMIWWGKLSGDRHEKYFTFPECYVKTPYNEAFSGIFFTRVQTLNRDWNETFRGISTGIYAIQEPFILFQPLNWYKITLSWS